MTHHAITESQKRVGTYGSFVDRPITLAQSKPHEKKKARWRETSRNAKSSVKRFLHSLLALRSPLVTVHLPFLPRISSCQFCDFELIGNGKAKKKERKTKTVYNLNLGQLTQAADRGADGAVVGGAKGVRATSHRLAAAVAAPDADSLAAEGELTAEGAEVPGVLGHLQLLRALTRVGAVTGAVAAHHAHLHGALRHLA